jgi:hypothetical protein
LTVKMEKENNFSKLNKLHERNFDFNAQ